MSTTKNDCNYRNLNVWDGVSSTMEPRDLSVRDGRFAAVTDAANAHDVGERDLTGLYAIPGLIDAHIHLCLNPALKDPLDQDKPGKDQLLAEMRERAFAMLKAGITTARDLGGGQYLELTIRDEIEAGTSAGPRLICAGQPITSPGGHCHFWGGEASDTEAALDVLRRQHDNGVDLIKVMATGGNITAGSKPEDSQFDDETIAEIVREAAARNYHVAAHCHGTGGIRQAANSGVRTIEHCSWVNADGWGRGFDQDVVEKLAAQGSWVSPTINSGWRRFKNEGFVQMVQGNYRAMKAAGVRLIASTDAGIPNVYHHDLPKALPEFARFAELTNVEVLRSATSDCAQAIDLGHVTGRIAEGFSADFVCYEANPLEDLSVLEQPVLVVVNGRVFEC